MVLIKDAYHPNGRLVPYRRQENLVGKCRTRKMTKEERERYGEPVVREKIEPKKEPPKPKGKNIPKDYAFADKVKTERINRGMSKRAFSEMIGIPAATLASVEKCTWGVREATRAKICEALGWEVE